MTTQTGATTEPTSHSEGVDHEASRDFTKLYQEGLVAGLVGAATVALWFLLVDTVQGRPLYTPTVLGSALFSRGAGAPWASALPNIEMVLMFTWVHGLTFVVIGGIVSHLLRVSGRGVKTILPTIRLRRISRASGTSRRSIVRQSARR